LLSATYTRHHAADARASRDHDGGIPAESGVGQDSGDRLALVGDLDELHRASAARACHPKADVGCFQLWQRRPRTRAEAAMPRDAGSRASCCWAKHRPKDVHTASIKLQLGETLMAMEQYEGARIMYTEALTPLVQALGPDHRDVIRTDIHLGYAELALGNLDEARSHCTRGLDLVKALAPDDPLAGEAKQCVEQLSKPPRKR
jgi:tetratricopeptide (TPR) repeat protein